MSAACLNDAACGLPRGLLDSSILLQSFAAVNQTHQGDGSSSDVGCMFFDPLAWRSSGISFTFCCTFVAMCLVWLVCYALLPPKHCMNTPTETVPLQSPETSSSKARVPRLLALDGLRVIFVTNVIVAHMGPKEVKAWTGWILPTPGVTMAFFMMLSGFVRCQSALGKPGRYNWSDYRNHIVRIIARFVPGYQVALIARAVARWSDGNLQPFLAWPLQALFAQNFFPFKVCAKDHHSVESYYLVFGGNGLGWFVSGVIISSVMFPLLYDHRPGGGREKSESHFTLVLCTLVAALAGVTVLSKSLPSGVVGVHFAPVFVLKFWSGMLCAQLFAEMIPRVQAWRGWGWVFDAAFICSTGMFQTMVRGETVPFAGSDLVLFSFLLLGARGAAAATTDGSAGSNSNGFFNVFGWAHNGILINIFSSRPFTALAEYSFGAYIYQWLAHDLLRVFFNVTPWWLPIPFAWGIAVMMEHVFEAPIRKAIESRIRGATSGQKS